MIGRINGAGGCSKTGVEPLHLVPDWSARQRQFVARPSSTRRRTDRRRGDAERADPTAETQSA